MLAAVSAVAEPAIAEVSGVAADRIRAAGCEVPDWVHDLRQPSTVQECRVLRDQDGDTFALAARFDRAGLSYAFVLLIEPDHCGAAAEIVFIDGSGLPDALAQIRAMAKGDGLKLVDTTLDPAEFRWEAEVAMDARAEHDLDDREFAAPEDVLALPEEDESPYRLTAPLLRARLRALPLSDKPKPVHNKGFLSPGMLEALSSLESEARRGFGRRLPARKPPKLRPRRKTRDGRAPILRVRVDLRYASPPIWRRLEVPGDIPLRSLHEALQVAFDWHNSHLYLFETDFGDFGAAGGPDARSDKNVTLEQIAREPGDKLTYRYDFGDDWEHVIAIEKSMPVDPSATYPRCTGGRRAAPPEDSGGIGGYAYTLDVLADPDHEEHEDRLDWLGLDRADEFDPAAFDMKAINEVLGRLR
jgi:hypothetical protein